MKDRVFTTVDKNGNELVLKFKRPNQTVLHKAELVRRTAFSRAFRQDIITNAEVEKLLRDRGLWDDEQQKKVNDLRNKVSELETKLGEELSDEQGEEICAELDKLRLQILIENSVYQNIADNTCETIAEEERNQFLCSECVVHDKTGIRVYKDIDDFKARLDEQMTADAFMETVIATLEARIGRSLPTRLSDEYVENKWRAERLKEAEGDKVDEVAEVASS